MLGLPLDLLDNMLILLVKREHLLLVLNVIEQLLIRLVFEGLSVFPQDLKLHLSRN
jgi:hypothetical protein